MLSSVLCEVPALESRHYSQKFCGETADWVCIDWFLRKSGTGKFTVR